MGLHFDQPRMNIPDRVKNKLDLFCSRLNDNIINLCRQSKKVPHIYAPERGIRQAAGIGNKVFGGTEV